MYFWTLSLRKKSGWNRYDVTDNSNDTSNVLIFIREIVDIGGHAFIVVNLLATSDGKKNDAFASQNPFKLFHKMLSFSETF